MEITESSVLDSCIKYTKSNKKYVKLGDEEDFKTISNLIKDELITKSTFKDWKGHSLNPKGKLIDNLSW
jgi:hypothetical protein